jgi:hypothetical protein
MMPRGSPVRIRYILPRLMQALLVDHLTSRHTSIAVTTVCPATRHLFSMVDYRAFSTRSSVLQPCLLQLPPLPLPLPHCQVATAVLEVDGFPPSPSTLALSSSQCRQELRRLTEILLECSGKEGVMQPQDDVLPISGHLGLWYGPTLRDALRRRSGSGGGQAAQEVEDVLSVQLDDCALIDLQGGGRGVPTVLAVSLHSKLHASLHSHGASLHPQLVTLVRSWLGPDSTDSHGERRDVTEPKAAAEWLARVLSMARHSVLLHGNRGGWVLDHSGVGPDQLASIT